MSANAVLDQLAAFFCVLVIVTVHEFGHALAATWLGDDTPRLQGRVTLNPAAHIDPLGTLLLPLIAMVLTATGSGAASFIIGWGRPVEYNPNNLRNHGTGPLLIALAGPLMNILLAILVMALARLGIVVGSAPWVEGCGLMAIISLQLFFLNMLPIPPLDGSYLLKHVTNMSWETFANFGRYGLIVLIIAIQLPFVRGYLATATGVSFGLLAALFGV